MISLVKRAVKRQFLATKNRNYGSRQNKTVIRFVTDRPQRFVGLIKPIEGSAFGTDRVDQAHRRRGEGLLLTVYRDLSG